MKQSANHFLPRTSTMQALWAFGLAAGLAIGTVMADPYPMPPKTPVDTDPSAPNSHTRKVLAYGSDKDGNKIPLKTILITNNTDGTLYPIMRDPNSSTTPDGKVGLYDPYDAPNKEYRGYVGYQDGGKYYFGLKAGQSIQIAVPLVFWNGARIAVGTNGEYLTPEKLPNPLGYDPKATTAIAPALSGSNTISNGIVMWYRAETAIGPAPDTDDQLAEFTFRDHNYLSNPGITGRTGGHIPDNQLVTLINYDVSFVDNLYLPLALEATDVWVVPQSAGAGKDPNRNSWKPGSDPDSYGWTGAIDTVDELQSKIRAFTDMPSKGDNAYLGKYFKGKGWPRYNIPNPNNNPNQPIKIPSGANIYAQSPLIGTPSSYKDGTWETNKYMLSSGGDEAMFVSITYSGAVINPKGSMVLNLDPNASAAQIAYLAKGQNVTGIPNVGKTNPIQPGTTVTDVDPVKRTVTLSQKLVSSSDGTSYQFSTPVDDYATDAMARLWFSWAQYYINNWKDNNTQAPTAPVQINGTMDAETARLSFNEPHPELVEGMSVKGPGLDSAMTEVGKHLGDAIILKIAEDKKSVIVSQIANKPSSSQPFTFSPPQHLYWAPKKAGDTGYPLLHFTFNTTQAWREPYEFSRTVYLIMASMNQIGKPNNNSLCKYMQDIVGANMGYIYDPAAKASTDGKMLQAMIRDMIKSALRGVSDFTKYPDVLDDKGNHIHWYPDPSKAEGGQSFNAFNLDPFVWFVHVKLGFSGYGFSVDDDTADIGAGGVSHVELAVSGTKGLTKVDEWTIQAPFGPVRDVLCTYSGTSHGDTLYNSIKNASNTTPIKITTAGQQNLKSGEIVVIDQVLGNTAANGTFKIQNVTDFSFDLHNESTGDPVAGNGQYNPNPTPGRWSYPLHPYIDTGSDLTKVFYRVTGDDALGTFQGTPVSVDVPTKKGEKIRVWQLGMQSKGRLLLNAPILNADGTPLAAGQYKFTFSGSYNNN